MSWQSEMTIMLRHIIGDVDSPQLYTDPRLEQSLVIAAQFVAPSLNFSQPFNIDVVGINISPDPTMQPTVDDWFTNLTVTKSAIIIVQGEVKTMTAGALMFQEFGSKVDMREGVKYKMQLLKDLIEQYDHAKLTYQMAIRPSVEAIIGPFNILAGNFRGPIYPYTQRDRIFI